MGKLLTLGLVTGMVSQSIASKNLDSYVLGTGEAGAKRLDFQSKLMNDQSFLHVAKAGIKPGAVVYDIGCGTGSMTEHLAKVVGSGGKVFAVDRSIEQLELAKKRIQEAGLTNVEFIQADITADDLAFPQPADAVYARMILSHLRSPEKSLKTLLSPLKAGGLVLLQEPVNSTNHAEGSDIVAPLVDIFMGNGKARGVDYDLGLKIQQMVTDQGLEVMDVFDWHVVMEPDVARDFLTVSFNEWGRAALRDDLIDQVKFDKCMGIAKTMDTRFHLATNVYLTARKPNSAKDFETEIAYFFGAPNPQLVADHYMKAISLIGDPLKRQDMLSHLTNAYEEVEAQTKLVFDTKAAAEHELDLILAHAEKRPFEEICAIMVNLYKTVFDFESPQIQKAAMLRTFLYQYKNRVTEKGALTAEDQALMISIARASERELNQLLPSNK